jgi:hypothetical protein
MELGGQPLDGDAALRRNGAEVFDGGDGLDAGGSKRERRPEDPGAAET